MSYICQLDNVMCFQYFSGMPYFAYNITLNFVSTNVIMASWEPVDTHGIPIRIQFDDSLFHSSSFLIPASANECTIANLWPASTYTVILFIEYKSIIILLGRFTTRTALPSESLLQNL